METLHYRKEVRMSGLRSIKVAGQDWTIGNILTNQQKKFKTELLEEMVMLFWGLKRTYSGRLPRKVLKHLAYSPDLAPSDYYLFSSLKDAL